MTRQEIGEMLDRERGVNLWWTLRIGNTNIHLSKVNWHIQIARNGTVVWATKSD